MKRHQEHTPPEVILTGENAVRLMAGITQFADAAERHKSARREEKQGYPLTAAANWRRAAELFKDEFLAESCWCEWERIMKLPRKFARSI